MGFYSIYYFMLYKISVSIWLILICTSAGSFCSRLRGQLDKNHWE